MPKNWNLHKYFHQKFWNALTALNCCIDYIYILTDSDDYDDNNNDDDDVDDYDDDTTTTNNNNYNDQR